MQFLLALALKTAMAASIMNAVFPAAAYNSSTCVSNRGRAYSEDNCNWYGRERGCFWNGEQCICKNGGFYSKRQRTCWPPSPAPSPTKPPFPGPLPPSPRPPRPSPVPPAPRPTPSPNPTFDGARVLEHVLDWFPGPRWVSAMFDGLVGISCTCALPCMQPLRFRARRLLHSGRALPQLIGMPQQRMLEDDDHIEVARAEV